MKTKTKKSKQAFGWTILKPSGDMWVDQLWPTRTAAIFYLVNNTNGKADYAVLDEQEAHDSYDNYRIEGWQVVKATISWN